MRFVLYVGAWTAFCLITLLLLRDDWFWPVAVVVWVFIWLVGIPIVLAQASERMTESLPDDDDAPR